MKPFKQSRQARWQERKKAQRQCIICGDDIHPMLGNLHCLKHAIKRREANRRRSGRKGRRYNSLTYRMERMQQEGKL